MKIFELAQTSSTPYFLLDFNNGYILYKGRFIPDIEPSEFIKPLRYAIIEYANSPMSETIIEVYYEYVNTGNLYTLLDFFKLIKKIEQTGSKLVCLWHYDDPLDEDSIDMCEQVSNYSGLEFHLIDDSKHVDSGSV